MAIAFAALAMNFVTFREFLRGLRARAEFDVDVTNPQADQDGVQRTTGNALSARVQIGIKNEGDKAAGETLINALVPRTVEPRWCGPNGEEKGPDAAVTAETSEMLIDSRGQEVPARYLAKMLPRVGTKPHHVVYFTFPIPHVPDDGEVAVPVVVRVEADEIPDDVEEYEAAMMFRVTHAKPQLGG